ncbi:hypothetical protein AVEN_38360-1 [Araneus ventricosus]|uniref:HAT C-terminal dimerisation domain-containing protein n=1 Tax=Araneus ventricosus TaxID=182803 RepID=A0A4Y2GVF4_ARAVE|nr:hypothetical protein AVEN_38360-1 [Araneus ventricosus]
MEINNKVLEFMPGNETVYKAVDMIMSEDPQDQLTFPEEFLNSLTPTGLPPYELKVENRMQVVSSRLPEKIKIPEELLEFIVSYGDESVFPNLRIALQILLTIATSIASSERFFSKLKLMLSYLRASMGQKRLCTNCIRTTSYHPQSNGLVERFHRHLKSSVITHSQLKWTETLPIVLLGIRSAVKPDINATCAELVYGTTLRLPSDIFNSINDLSTPTDTYVLKFKSIMQSINPISTSRHSIKAIYIHPSLQTCSHVFLRVDSVEPPLSPPYTGPHPVISRKEKTFVLKINDKNINYYRLSSYQSSVSLLSTPTSTHKLADAPSPIYAPENEPAIVKPITTRSERHVHFPKRLITVV